MCSVLEAPLDSGLRVSRVSLHKHWGTGADVEKESVATSIFSSISKEKRDRDKKCCAFVERQGESSKTLGTDSGRGRSRLENGSSKIV